MEKYDVLDPSKDSRKELKRKSSLPLDEIDTNVTSTKKIRNLKSNFNIYDIAITATSTSEVNY